MSHIWAARVAYVLALLLVGGAALFAWAQSDEEEASLLEPSIQAGPGERARSG
jgi:hypothetical protein